MSYIKRKRDQRDHKDRRALLYYVTQPLRIMPGLTEPPPQWEPAHDRIWVTETTEAAPNRAASRIPRRKR